MTPTLLSPIIYGLWRLADDPSGTSSHQVRAKIDAALSSGITSFDHADIYGRYTCEALFGAALKESPSLRPAMQLITKCGIKPISEPRGNTRVKQYNSSRAHILASVDDSLKALHTEYLDFLLLHRPDPLMDADEVAEAFSTLKENGKVRHFGVSNFSVPQMELLGSRLPFPLATNQVELSVLHRLPLENGVLDYCQRMRIPVMAWSPFAGGTLFSSADPAPTRTRETLALLAEPRGATPEQLALSWLLSLPARVHPIIGTNALARIPLLSQAATLSLSREEWFLILEAAVGASVP